MDYSRNTSCLCRSHLLRLLLTLCFLAGVGSVGGCEAPHPTLVVVVGGLGLNQLGDLREAVKEQCPDTTVVSAGPWDGFRADIGQIVASNSHKRIILVGHSFGCEAVAKAAEKLPRVDLTIFIDPAWDDFPLPRQSSNYLWFQRSEADIEREATIIGASNITTIQGGHNAIPHSPELIAEVVAAINRKNFDFYGKPPARGYAFINAEATSPQRIQRTAVADPR